MLDKSELLITLSKLIDEGQQLPKAGPGLARGSWLYQPREFAAWKIKAAALVHKAVPTHHPLYKQLGLIARAASSDVEHWVGALQGLRVAVSDGLLESVVDEAREEVSADDLTVAQDALDSTNAGMSYVAAAVLAGAVLERTLRRFCETNGIKALKDNGERKALNALISDAWAGRKITAIREKQMRVWATIRNDAAHGYFDRFDRATVVAFLRDLPPMLAELR